MKKHAITKDYILFIGSSERDQENVEKISQLSAARNVKGVINGSMDIGHLFRLKLALAE